MFWRWKKENRFNEFATAAAVLNGIVAFLYAVSFIILSRSVPELGNVLSPALLMIGGVLTSAVVAELYQRLHKTEGGFALWALLLGILGSMGAVVHGGFDLANAIHIPDSTPAYQASLPNTVDPRGLLTFGMSGLSLLVWAWLLDKHKGYTKWFVRASYTLAILLVFLFLARLTILEANHPLVAGLAIVTGFLVNPLWYLWLGSTWWRNR